MKRKRNEGCHKYGYCGNFIIFVAGERYIIILPYPHTI